MDVLPSAGGPRLRKAPVVGPSGLDSTMAGLVVFLLGQHRSAEEQLEQLVERAASARVHLNTDLVDSLVLEEEVEQK